MSHHSWVVHNRECTANQNRGWGRNDARNPRDQEGRGSGGNARGDARSQEGRGHSRNARDPNSGEGRRRSRERSGGRRSTSQRSTSQERKIDQEIQWRTQNRDGADPRYPASRGPEQDARPWNRGPDLRHGQTPTLALRNLLNPPKEKRDRASQTAIPRERPQLLPQRSLEWRRQL